VPRGQQYRRWRALLIALIAASVAAACGSTSVTQVAGPDDVRCQTTLSAAPQSVAAGGGAVSIAVATTRDCAWTASSDASWIRLSTSSGQGEATFTANVDANPQIVSRSGNVTVNARRLAIVQDGRPCTFDVSPAAIDVAGGGGSHTIQVTAPAGCTWRASTTSPWITVPGETKTGSGSFSIQAAANDGAARTGTITIADRIVTVTQAAAAADAPQPNCLPTVTPLTIDAAAAPSTQLIQLTIGATCPWSASSGAGWLTITSAPAGTGSATVTVAVAQNSGIARTGTITVAGQQVTIRQTALSCAFTLNPSSQSFLAQGGSGKFTVNTLPACTWTASKNVTWITLATTGGTGTGDVDFTVIANGTTTARSATINVGGHAFTVNQAAAACQYTLTPASVNIGAEGGRSRFNVTTSPNCTWTAAPAVTWVKVLNPSGNGSGEVNFDVESNPGTTGRSTTITAGGQTFTVNQAAIACTYSASPASLSIGANGGEGRFTLTTQAGCSWTASAGATWVTVTTPSGTGTADVVYTVQANSDPAARSTTVTANGQTHTVNQAGAPAPCTYSIEPSAQAFAAAGGSSMFRLTTQTGCAWTASTASDWISLPNQAGTGTSDIPFTVQANSTGAPRSGSIVVAGQTFSVTQAQ
jgi:hypothetical protein